MVLHGFTGTPHSMRALAHGFAAAGFAVELPLLPGHGTSVVDMEQTRWEDWSQFAEQTYLELAGRCERVLVAGLSMGGTIAVWLAERHQEIAGLVVVNPLVEPPAQAFRDILTGVLDSGSAVMPGIGSDIARPGAPEVAYEATPIEAALSLFGGVEKVAADLGNVRCPMLWCSSLEDHVVPTSSGDLLAATVSGDVERVVLERSYHVATLDYDAELIERRAVEFALRVTART